MTDHAKVLVLGGSSEGVDVAGRLAATGIVEVIYSLAGRTNRPRWPFPAESGRVRTGGFGGVDGLERWLTAERVTAVIDATHPFAAAMPHHAAEACIRRSMPRLRLRRPEWTPGPGDRWTVVADLAHAARTLGALGARRVFLTTGRQDLAPFAGLDDTWFLVRSIEAPDPQPLRQATVVLDRGPFDADAEEALMAQHRVDAMVTKNSGGAAAAAKLVAARRRGLPVVVVARPPAPDGPMVTTVDAALAWWRDIMER